MGSFNVVSVVVLYDWSKPHGAHVLKRPRWTICHTLWATVLTLLPFYSFVTARQNTMVSLSPLTHFERIGQTGGLEWLRCSDEELAKRVQLWLYFGLLSEFCGRVIPRASLRAIDQTTKSPRLCTTQLSQLLQAQKL